MSQLLPPMVCTNAMSSVSLFQSRTVLKANPASAGFPDPFAVATMSGEQTRTTTVIKKTLNPYWNECFDMLGRSIA